MKQVPVQTDNVTQLAAADFNPIPRETENAIKAQSIALDNSGVNVFQLAEAISEAVTVNDLYQDSGAANAYILAPVSQRKAITKYIDSMVLRFEPAVENTGNSTVNVNSLGVKSIFLQEGSEIPSGTLLVGVTYQIQYDLGNDRFFISSVIPVDIKKLVYGENLLTNFNFSVETPDDSQPIPDATPRSYAPDYQVFYGWFADSGVGVTDLTYVGGVINFSAGAIYQDVTYDGGLQAVAGVIASIAADDLIGTTSNVTLTDTGTAWRVSIESTASATLSVKLEAGDKITGHVVLNYESAFATAAKNGLFQGIPYTDTGAIGANPTAKIYPDGTIVGNTDNGSYTKSPNGNLVCRNIVDGGITSTVMGAVFRSSGVAAIFPILFVSTPTTAISANYASGLTFAWAGESGLATVSGASLLLFGASNDVGANITYIANGRWK